MHFSKNALGAACSINGTRDGGFAVHGACARSSVGDLLCENEDWTQAKARACVGL